MKISSEAEFDEALERFVHDVLEHYRGGASVRDGLPAALRELKDAVEEFKKTATRYHVMCIKTHYAGQGVDWEAGQCYGSYYTRAMAERTLKEIDNTWSAGCWELVVQPPESMT